MAEMTGYVGLQRRLTAIGSPNAMSGLMRRLAVAAVGEQKALAPRKTDNLRRTIHVGTVTPRAAQTVASASYAVYVEKGTGPHEITPRARKALRFAARGVSVRLTGTPTKAAQRAGGAWAFAKRVHHPGTRAHPFMLPGAETAVRRAGLTKAIIVAWNEAA